MNSLINIYKISNLQILKNNIFLKNKQWNNLKRALELHLKYPFIINVKQQMNHIDLISKSNQRHWKYKISIV